MYSIATIYRINAILNMDKINIKYGFNCFSKDIFEF